MIHEEDGRQALLTLYGQGHEPDPEVYAVLRTLPGDHVPEILETGRWQERAFEVSEDLQAGTLADVGLLPDDVDTLSRVLTEIGSALHAFAERGLRHRDLHPGAVLVRTREPLDLVITNFGSARLSDFDLDIVSPLETTRYTAPEAIAGGVAAASDWWSLGMLLLEQVTRGACFNGVNDQAFLIHVLTNGAPIPESLPPPVELLLRGLLAPDRRERWAWAQVEQWLAGGAPPAPASARAPAVEPRRHTIQLAGRRFATPTAFALAAAEQANWEEARGLFLRGAVATWAEDAGLGADLRAELRRLGQLENVPEDIRLALALKELNPAMPLVCRGEIITPGWLLDHVNEGYELISGPVPEMLKRRDSELWLARLKARAELVRERAQQFQISLDEQALRIHLLSSSRSRLAAVWADRRRILPDTDHPGLIAILERRQTTDEDYILLLSADTGQFRTAEAIVEEAAELARQVAVDAFDPTQAASRLERPRREIFREIEDRLKSFARCGLERIDGWADQYRLERRLSIGRALVLLAVPADAWSPPPKQEYVATLLDFFAKRITSSVMRGPLTRMVIGKTAARMDLTELHSERRPASAVLDHLLLRNDQLCDLDPAIFGVDATLEARLRRLHAHATLYRRDTGIDGLYLGFPFLFMQERKTPTRPRIAPVLLWPIRLIPEVGARGRIRVGFDRDREEVRVNPAFEMLLGAEATRRWTEIAHELLSRASLNASEVLDALGTLAKVEDRALTAIPGKDARVRPGDDRLVCAGSLFHLAYFGQAVMEDLRQLKGIPLADTSLESLLRVGLPIERAAPQAVREVDRYFTAASDPSQEQAVIEARSRPGLVIQGPPGTGKSQTIVNMVADAIGRQKRLLIVCQKQAALDVVHKRLTAEGLGDRIVMVSDVNKDRQPIIRAVREQLDALWGSSSHRAGWRQQRTQLAARIEALEADLDQHHAALHTLDEPSGMSYRFLLGELMGFEESHRRPVDCPAIRTLVAGLDHAEVATLQEACGPLARLWLPALFEDSPLSALEPFSVDTGTLGSFESDLSAFRQAEETRDRLLAEAAPSIAVQDPAACRAWAERHAETFLALDDGERERLARWLDVLVPAGAPRREPELLRELAEIESALESLLPRATSGPEAVLAASMKSSELSHWCKLADALSNRPGVFGRLSPVRWIRRRRLSAYLRKQSLGDSNAFQDALHSELALRPWRERLAQARVLLNEPPIELGPIGPRDLVGVARTLHEQLARAEGLVRTVGEHPEREPALRAVRPASRAAFEGFCARVVEGCRRHEAHSASVATLEALKPWCDEAWRTERRESIQAAASNARALGAIGQAASTVAAYQRFRARAARLDARALAAFRALRSVAGALNGIPECELDDEVRRIIGRESRLAWKARIETKHPVLLFEASELQAKVVALAQADVDIRTLNRRLLVEGIDMASVRPTREWEDVTRLAGQRARRLREFLDRGADLGLMSLRPVWLMNPDVASRVLPLKRATFDTVIYDEASQMPIEYAIPSLFRSRTAIVSGDEKQMPPTSFFTSKVESDEAGVFEGEDADDPASDEQREELAETWNRREIKDCPDILQLARTVLPTTTLQIHYRSVYRELIEFSNASFYGNGLSVPVRHPEDEVRRVKPIEVVRVDGVYESQTNPAEAEQVADVVGRLWSVPREERESVGVVTFNRRQADLIYDVLEARAERDAAFRSALVEERERVEDGEDMGFFVKNVENVQGDERDVIVFSSTFGRNAQRTFRRSFGVLGQVGGERRLNVAVTRARKKVYLVTSMPVPEIADFLTTRRLPAAPRDYLQAYCEYARALSDGDLPFCRMLLSRLVTERGSGVGRTEADQDGFQTAVAAHIKKLGWCPVSAADTSAFGLDFAIEDPRTGLYGIGIECDAPTHPLLARARAREMWRPEVLRRSIPVVHRVSSHGWLHEPAEEKGRLDQAIRRALHEEVAA